MERIKIIILFFFISFINVFAQNGDVSFPYFLTLQDGTDIPKGLYLPDSLSNHARFTTEGLFLTHNKQLQFGAILMQDMSFTSSNGIEVSFEFNTYGGTDPNGTDGFIMFLYDGSIPDSQMTMGGGGRSMGYVYHRTSEANAERFRKKGLPGAYLGVALNNSGNHKGQIFDSETRMNGINFSSWGNGGVSHVTLRGAEYKLPATDNMQGYRGYPVLKTVSTLSTSSSSNGSAELNSNNGTYTFGRSAPGGFSFHLRNGVITSDPLNENFRKAFISLIPHIDGGFSVTVRIQHGRIETTVIDKYHYAETIRYFENAEGRTSDFSGIENDTRGSDLLMNLNAAVPARFKVGFAGITGGRTDTHMIRNLLISVPYAAFTTDKSFTVCDKIMSEFMPFDNDYAYTNHISNPTPSVENIDPDSFMFFPIAGGELIDNHHYSDENGLWSFDPRTNLISFYPKEGFAKEGAQVRYTIKGFMAAEGVEGQPYGDEMYRSNPSIITLIPKECPIYVNPNLRTIMN